MAPPILARPGNTVPACATPARITAFLRQRNPGLAPRFDSLAALYKHYGEQEGIRWDYAFFQMMVETAALTFRCQDGTPAAVAPEQNNLAGLGAIGGGVRGEQFADLETGVRAHLQHVRLYAGERIAEPIAERTRKVQAWGVLAQWQRPLGGTISWADLARHWAPGDTRYGVGIQADARRFYATGCTAPEPPPAVAAVQPSRTPRASETGDAAAGLALARQAAARANEESAAPRAGLGASALLSRPEPDNQPAAPLDPAARPIRILNPGPPATARPAPIALPSPVPAAPDPADEALRALVSGRTVNLDTPIGTIVPITFHADGTARGRAGSVAFHLGAPADEGRWWIERARLCQKWNVWFDREVQCLRLRQTGEVIHWTRDDGRTGTARLAKP